jgi:hypothetical protein
MVGIRPDTTHSIDHNTTGESITASDTTTVHVRAEL